MRKKILVGLKRLTCIALAGVLLFNSVVTSYATDPNASSTATTTTAAKARGQELIAFMENKEISEDMMKNMIDAASNPEMIQLMGVFVSNWFYPGMVLDVSTPEALAADIQKIIVDNLHFPEEVAGAYASGIAANMLNNNRALNVSKGTANMDIKSLSSCTTVCSVNGLYLGVDVGQSLYSFVPSYTASVSWDNKLKFIKSYSNAPRNKSGELENQPISWTGLSVDWVTDSAAGHFYPDFINNTSKWISTDTTGYNEDGTYKNTGSNNEKTWLLANSKASLGSDMEKGKPKSKSKRSKNCYYTVAPGKLKMLTVEAYLDMIDDYNTEVAKLSDYDQVNDFIDMRTAYKDKNQLAFYLAYNKFELLCMLGSKSKGTALYDTKEANTNNGLKSGLYRFADPKNPTDMDKTYMKSIQSRADIAYKVYKRQRAVLLGKGGVGTILWYEDNGAAKIVWNTNNKSCVGVGGVYRNILMGAENTQYTSADEYKIVRTKLLSNEGNIDSELESQGWAQTLGTGDNKLLVDSFGNIFTSNGIVLITGCSNPYSFSEDARATNLISNQIFNSLYGNGAEKSGGVGNLKPLSGQTEPDGVPHVVKRVNMPTSDDYGNYGVAYMNLSARESGYAPDSKKVSDVYTQDNINLLKKRIKTVNIDYETNGGMRLLTNREKSAAEQENFSFNPIDQVKAVVVSVSSLISPDYKNDTSMYVSDLGSGIRSVDKADDIKVIDCVAYAGAWEVDGQFGEIISNDGWEQYAIGSSIRRDKMGESQWYTASVNSPYAYGIYVMYGSIILGETIEIDGESYDFSTWNGCSTYPECKAELDIEAFSSYLSEKVSAQKEDEMKSKLLVMIYTILDNTQDAWDYITSLISKRMKEVALGWHYDILGINSNIDNSALGGNQYYTSTSGFITVPEMCDISWISSILDNFDTLVAVCMIILSAILILFIVVNQKTPQRAIVHLVLFAVILYTVPSLLSATITQSNKISGSITRRNFKTYVINQQQSFITELDSAYEKMQSGDEDGAVVGYLQQANSELAAFANGSSATASVKWMCPKKDNYIEQLLGKVIETDSDESLSLTQRQFRSTVQYIATTTFSGQKYTNQNTNYLYRSYTDISMYAKILYEGAGKVSNVGSDFNSWSAVPEDRQHYNSGVSVANYKNERGVAGEGKKIAETLDRSNTVRFSYAQPSSATSTIAGYLDKSIDTKTSKSLKGGSVDYIPNILGARRDSMKLSTVSSASSISGSDYSDYQFLVYSESPFYYLFNSLADQAGGISASEGYKNLVLTEGWLVDETDSTREEYGATKDFMDFEGMFKVVLPMMRACNDIVRDYDSIYGMSLYNEYKVDDVNDSDIKKNEEAYFKAWHNNNVSRLWDIYSPWLDMIECADYAKAERITTMCGGIRVTGTVEDPLNPASYKKIKRVNGEWVGRDMVFGEADMLKHGLKYSQLTTVEKKIYKVLEESKEDLTSLLNYYSYDNQVLYSAAAMEVTFNFNKEFSEKKLAGEGAVLYPQGYETKNMSFDTYLRLALINSTGMSIVGQGDSGVYQTVVSNTNTFVAFLMVLNDILAIYVLTFLKVLLVTLLFLLGIMSVVCAISVDEMKLLNTFKENVLIPLAKFFLTAIGHAIIASVLMGTSATNVITDTSLLSSNMKSPETVMVGLLVLDVIVTILFAKSALDMAKRLAKLTVAAVSSIGGAITTLGGNIAGSLSGGKFSGGTLAASLGGAYLTSRAIRKEGKRADKRANRFTSGMPRGGSNEKEDGSAETKSRSERLLDFLESKDKKGDIKKKWESTKLYQGYSNKKRLMGRAGKLAYNSGAATVKNVKRASDKAKAGISTFKGSARKFVNDTRTRAGSAINKTVDKARTTKESIANSRLGRNHSAIKESNRVVRESKAQLKQLKRKHREDKHTAFKAAVDVKRSQALKFMSEKTDSIKEVVDNTTKPTRDIMSKGYRVASTNIHRGATIAQYKAVNGMVNVVDKAEGVRQRATKVANTIGVGANTVADWGAGKAKDLASNTKSAINKAPDVPMNMAIDRNLKKIDRIENKIEKMNKKIQHNEDKRRK